MPRQHHHHGPELGALGPPGHVGEELEHVRAHRVVGEVMLDAPDRLEPQRLDQVTEPQLLLIDFAIRTGVLGVLEQGGHPDVHDTVLLQGSATIG